MKTRLYNRNVVTGQTKYKELVNETKREFKTRLTVLISGFILALIIAIISTILLSKYTNFPIVSVYFVPVIVTPVIREIMYLNSLKKDLNILTLDKSIYSDWMKIQLRKEIPQADYQEAIELFKKYKSSYKECHKELIAIIKDELKTKPAKQLTISMLCGLIFLSGNRSDHNLLFKAKYKHGAAGNIIPEIWISVLSADTEDFEASHNKCSREFLEYWDAVLNT